MSNRMITRRPRFGVHISLGNTPRAALRDAHGHGVECVQIFASSPSAWKPPILHELRVTEAIAARKEFDIAPLFIHAIYLINLASDNPTLVARSKTSLIETLHAGAALDAQGVVTHIGSHGGRGFDAIAGQVASALFDVLAAGPDGVQLILENSAGTGGIIGSQLAELGELMVRTGCPENLRVALDTAHLCASGWDFAAEPRSAEQLVIEVDEAIGLDRLVLMHGNDAKTPAGSRRDRHANVGDGFVGLSGFRHLFSCPALRAVPWILETPDLGDSPAPGGRFGSLSALRQLAEESAGAPGVVG